MQDIIFFLLIGIGIGALYAVLGAGIVVVYKGSGVINFAHGAMAMYGMFTFDTAWNRGELFLPWVDFLPTHTVNLPTRITLSESGSWPMVPSLILALAMAALIGAAAHFLIFGPLRDAAPLGKVVASLGLALYLQGVALLNFGNSFPVPKSVVPDGVLQNFLGLGRPFPINSLYTVLMAVLMGLALWGVYRFTNFGLATRAAASNEKGAILLGYSPQRLAAINWIGASMLATLAAIIVGPIQGAITPIGLTALIVPALAAALIGSLRSVPIAVAGGLGLGMVQKLFEVKGETWFADIPLLWIKNGFTQAIPLLVIVAVLFLRGRSLPIRGTVAEKRLPLSPNPKRMLPHAVVWVTVVTVAALTFQNSGRTTSIAGAIQLGLGFSIIMLSMVVLTGYVGQISLAQMSLAGVSAFFMARMLADGTPQGSNLVPVTGPGLEWPIAAILGVIAAVAVGVLLGLPALRIRGVQLAVVTIAAAIALQALYLENEELTQLRAGVPAFVEPPSTSDLPVIGDVELGSRSDRVQNERPAFAIFSVLILAAVAFAVSNIRRTGTGRRFLAVRANERAAAAAGINIPRTKLLAFAISAGIAGIGGVMLAFRQVDVSSANFPYGVSLAVLAFAYLGGITSINGGIVAGMLMGGSLVPVVSNYFFAETNIERYVGLLGGLGMIVTARIHPEGIAPFFQGAMQHAGNWLLTAIPGAKTVHGAFVGAQRKPLGIAGLVGVVALGFYVRNSGFITLFPLRILSVIALVVIGIMVAAIALGGLKPTFGQVGAVWVDWARRFGPTALLGYAFGWAVWPLRVETYHKFWMPLVGVYLALTIRAIYRQIRGIEPDATIDLDDGSGQEILMDERSGAISGAAGNLVEAG